MNKQETTADIIADMRGGPISQHRRDQELLRYYADRLEAAWKREVDALTAKLDEARHCWKVWSDRADELLTMCNEQYAKLKTVGDAAKLREALEVLLNAMCSCDDHLPPVIREGELREAYRKAESALAAPPRNCDIHTDFNDAITTFANKRNWHDGKWNSERYCIFASWLLALATEQKGGNNVV